jgi:outer membrane protein OmpA-like peptidoglycan-associated protein
MKKIITLIVFLIVSFSGNSQERKFLFQTGFYASYMRNIHIPDFDSLPQVTSCCKKYTSKGYGNGFSLGLLFDFDIVSDIKLGLRAGLSTLSGDLLESENIGNQKVYDLNTKSYLFKDIVVDHRLTSVLYDMGLEPIISYYPIKQLFIAAGFKVGFLFSGIFSYEERLTSPENVLFTDESVTRNDKKKNEPLPNKNSIQLFGSVGAGYRFKLASHTYLSPEMKIYFPFTNLTNVNWKVMSISLGASINFPIFAAPEKVFLKDTVYLRDTTTKYVIGLQKNELKRLSFDDSEAWKITKGDTIIEKQTIVEKYELSVPKDAELKTKISAVGITKEGLRKENPEIIIEEMEESELFPLLPQVFFAEGSSKIDPNQQMLIKKVDAEVFNEESLNWNTLKIYANLLNVIGLRLKFNPNADITLIGCNSGIGAEKNNKELSKSRAVAIKDYLVNTWGVNPKNIKTISKNLPDKPSKSTILDGQQENQRVEIISDNPEILKPVTLKQITRTSNPPVVEILPEIISEAELKSWRITVTQDGNPIRDYDGIKTPNTIKWNVEEKPIPVVEAPINIQLTAINEYNLKSVADKKLTIQQKTIKKKREEIKDDKIIEKFSLIVFDFDKANLTENQAGILEQIKPRIKENSKVVIAGYADRTGDPEYNKELALRRCQEVQKYLNVNEENLKLNPIGSDELIYNNDIPQGRSYSRTVKITIETPVR